MQQRCNPAATAQQNAKIKVFITFSVNSKSRDTRDRGWTSRQDRSRGHGPGLSFVARAFRKVFFTDCHSPTNLGLGLRDRRTATMDRRWRLGHRVARSRLLSLERSAVVVGPALPIYRPRPRSLPGSFVVTVGHGPVWLSILATASMAQTSPVAQHIRR